VIHVRSIRLTLLIALTASACARQPAPEAPPQEVAAAEETRPGSKPSPVVLIAVGALILVAIAVASAADSEPFLDYSDICGTPDCS
jgi:hypothetical protein